MENKRNNIIIRKNVTIAVLAALAIVLGLWEIPWTVGLIPALRIELSDVITLIALGLVGISGTSIMLGIKAIARFLIIRLSTSVFGPAGGMYEELIALLASFAYVFGFFISSKITLNMKTWVKHTVNVLFVTLFVSVVMVFSNFIFSTPMYLYFVLGADTFHPTVFTMIKDSAYTNPLLGLKMPEVSLWGFFIFCIIAYLPFNLVKASISTTIGTIVADILRIIPFIRDMMPQKELNNVNADEQIVNQD